MLRISAKFTVIISVIVKVSDIVRVRYDFRVRVSVKVWSRVSVR